MRAYKADSLFNAIKKGHLDQVTHILNQEPKLRTARTRNQDNALHLAAFWGRTEIVSTLLDQYGFEIEERNQQGQTPLLLAAKGGRFQTMRLLVGQKANLQACDQHGNEAIHLAAYSVRHTEFIEILLDQFGFTLEQQGVDGRTPLLCAAAGGNISVFRLLIARGANPEACDEYGNNALHLAARFELKPLLTPILLNQYGYGLEVKSHHPVTQEKHQGFTALLHAVQAKNFEMVEYLVLQQRASLKATIGPIFCRENAIDLARAYLREDDRIFNFLINVQKNPTDYVSPIQTIRENTKPSMQSEEEKHPFIEPRNAAQLADELLNDAFFEQLYRKLVHARSRTLKKSEIWNSFKTKFKDLFALYLRSEIPFFHFHHDEQKQLLRQRFMKSLSHEEENPRICLKQPHTKRAHLLFYCSIARACAKLGKFQNKSSEIDLKMDSEVLILPEISTSESSDTTTPPPRTAAH